MVLTKLEAACKRMQIGPSLTSCIKFKDKWIKNLSIKPDTLNFIEEKVGNSLEHIGKGVTFRSRTPKVQVLRSMIKIGTS